MGRAFGVRSWAGVCLALCVGCQGELHSGPGGGGASATEDASTRLDVAPAEDASSGPRDAEAARDTGAPDAREDAPDAPPGEDAELDVAPDAPPPYAGSEGCRGGAGIPEGENTFTLDGMDRRYVMRLPSNYSPDRPWPLIFALHGNGGTTDYWDDTGGSRDIRSEVDEEAIVVVAAAIDRQWRDYDQDRALWPERIEQELRYFDHIIEESKSELCVDERAIFAMGFSGGGSFSGVLGCRRDDIRAIAVGGSVIYFEQDACVGTPAAWITIGTQELAQGRVDYREFFRARAGCEESSAAAAPSPCEAYEGCGEGTPVHYCQHPDGHIWPGFGTAAAWTFFAQFVEPVE